MEVTTDPGVVGSQVWGQGNAYGDSPGCGDRSNTSTTGQRMFDDPAALRDLLGRFELTGDGGDVSPVLGGLRSSSPMNSELGNSVPC